MKSTKMIMLITIIVVVIGVVAFYFLNSSNTVVNQNNNSSLNTSRVIDIQEISEHDNVDVVGSLIKEKFTI